MAYEVGPTELVLNDPAAEYERTFALTKELIEANKRPYNAQFFELVAHSGERAIQFTLENIGRLSDDFDASWFVSLLDHPKPNIRLLAAKNVGKIEDPALLDVISGRLANENNTLVRRELVSAIGRMRSEGAIPVLKSALNDEDPKVVLQAIRGLLCFKSSSDVASALKYLSSHPNELVRSSIEREFRQVTTAKDQTKGTHTESPKELRNLLVCGDVREVLAHVPDESVHLTFTSPPYYNARDYAIYQSYRDYLRFLTDVFREVHRITKEGRFFVLNTSPVIVPRMSRAHASARYLIPFDIHPLIVDIGFDFIDDIVWLKPDPSAKNRNGGFYQHRKPLGYKANCVTEYVIVYRKRTTKLIDWNMCQYPEEVVDASKVTGDYEKTNAWRIAPSSDALHPAVFPVELASRVIRFYSYVGDLVFDPFAGSGTVGKVAQSLNRYFLMTEKEPDYCETAFQSLTDGNLFVPTPPRYATLEQFASEAINGADDDHQ
jgi:DNA modification methylase